MEYYIAGGAVRDLLLGKEPKDIDVVFNGSTSLFLQNNPKARKVIRRKKEIFFLNGKEFCQMQRSPDQDVLQRDFTINALLIGTNGVIYAHPQSFKDLQKGIIRPVCTTALTDDPLRIFRAARLVSTFPSFTVDDSFFTLAKQVAPKDIESLAAERVGREIIKSCVEQEPGNFLLLLAKAQQLSYWFAEISNKALSIPAGSLPYHTNSVLEHTAQCMTTTAKIAKSYGYFTPFDTIRKVAVWMALCHDLGKIVTDEKNFPHHYSHEHKGVFLAETLSLRLRLPKKYVIAGKLASSLHMKAGIYPELRAGTQVDLLTHANKHDLLIPLFILAEADSGKKGLLDMAMRDIQIILSVSLPQKWRNKGIESSIHLRLLRCEALVKSR